MNEMLKLPFVDSVVLLTPSRSLNSFQYRPIICLIVIHSNCSQSVTPLLTTDSNVGTRKIILGLCTLPNRFKVITKKKKILLSTIRT